MNSLQMCEMLLNKDMKSVTSNVAVRILLTCPSPKITLIQFFFPHFLFHQALRN